MPVRRARRSRLPADPYLYPLIHPHVHLTRLSESPTTVGCLLRLRAASELAISRVLDVSVQSHPNFLRYEEKKRFFSKLDFRESAFDLERALSAARKALLRADVNTEDTAKSLAFSNLVSALHWVDGARTAGRAAAHPANYIGAASALLRLLGSDASGALGP